MNRAARIRTLALGGELRIPLVHPKPLAPPDHVAARLDADFAAALMTARWAYERLDADAMEAACARARRALERRARAVEVSNA